MYLPLEAHVVQVTRHQCSCCFKSHTHYSLSIDAGYSSHNPVAECSQLIVKAFPFIFTYGCFVRNVIRSARRLLDDHICADCVEYFV